MSETRGYWIGVGGGGTSEVEETITEFITDIVAENEHTVAKLAKWCEGNGYNRKGSG